MNEQISIIVPVYNAEKTLERCVRSLQGQHHEDIEIILVNDGSKDDSLAICREFAREDGRVRVIDKPNGGVSSARNAGLDVARGEFVMFCDSDDWAEPDWCTCLLENYIPGNLTVCEICREDIPEQIHSLPEETVPRAHYLHHPMLMCSPFNKLFCRSVIENNGIRFPRKLSLGEDFVFCLRYLCCVEGSVRFVYRMLYNYDTSNENSLSGQAPALEQCDLFYREVTAAMEKLNAVDPESIKTRDTFVAPHFERNLKATACRRDLSLGEKLTIARKISRMESFRNTCRQGIRWGNPIYLWLCRKGYLRLAMLYLIARGA